jgi:hypothetical protein
MKLVMSTGERGVPRVAAAFSLARALTLIVGRCEGKGAVHWPSLAVEAPRF